MENKPAPPCFRCRSARASGGGGAAANAALQEKPPKQRHCEEPPSSSRAQGRRFQHVPGAARGAGQHLRAPGVGSGACQRTESSRRTRDGEQQSSVSRATGTPSAGLGSAGTLCPLAALPTPPSPTQTQLIQASRRERNVLFSSQSLNTFPTTSLLFGAPSIRNKPTHPRKSRL